MNRFMRIVALLMGLFVVLGCQSKQEAPAAEEAAEAMQGATDDASKRAIQKNLLRQLPKGAVQIKKKYRA